MESREKKPREIMQFPLISLGAAVISSASFNYRGRNWASDKINSTGHMQGSLIRAALICEQSCSEKWGMTYWLTAKIWGPCKQCPLTLGFLYQWQGLVFASMFAAHIWFLFLNEGMGELVCLWHPRFKVPKIYLCLDGFVLSIVLVACYATMVLLCQLLFQSPGRWRVLRI